MAHVDGWEKVVSYRNAAVAFLLAKYGAGPRYYVRFPDVGSDVALSWPLDPKNSQAAYALLIAHVVGHEAMLLANEPLGDARVMLEQDKALFEEIVRQLFRLTPVQQDRSRFETSYGLLASREVVHLIGQDTFKLNVIYLAEWLKKEVRVLGEDVKKKVEEIDANVVGRPHPPVTLAYLDDFKRLWEQGVHVS